MCVSNRRVPGGTQGGSEGYMCVNEPGAKGQIAGGQAAAAALKRRARSL